MPEQGAGVLVAHQLVVGAGVDDDAAVERPERGRVAVALQELAEGVPEGAFAGVARAAAVGDDGDQPLVGVLPVEVDRVGGGELGRHEHGLARADAGGGQPPPRSVVVDHRARGEGQR